jgi:competence protein CoiA
MLYANCNGSRCTATPKNRGTCPYCNSEVHAKCGSRYIWHWAHVSKEKCDSWREGETDWHREWKSHFPSECQEYILHDQISNEKHVADVKTLNGMFIEFQNSSLSPDEIRSREAFYGRMFWIVNGAKFRDNFIISDKMLSLVHERYLNLRIALMNNRLKNSGKEQSRNPNRIPFLIMINNPKVDLHTKNAIEPSDNGHRYFQWKRARTAWYSAEKPVIFDFGEKVVYRMQKYLAQSFFVVKPIPKENLIIKNGGIPKPDSAQ